MADLHTGPVRNFEPVSTRGRDVHETSRVSGTEHAAGRPARRATGADSDLPTAARGGPPRSFAWTLAAALLLGLGLMLAPGAATPVHAQGIDTPQAETQAEHVVLISIDGFRPEFYMDRTWPAAMLQRMAAEGIAADAVRGVTPTVTYPSHTTIATGALPARHGIVHNRPFEPGGATGAWYIWADSIRVPTLWDAASDAGRTSAGISWPVSVGADITWNIPEQFSVTGEENGVTGMAANTVALRAAVTPEGLLEEIEAESLGPFPDFYWGRNRSREDVTGAMAGHLIENHQPNLLMVHLTQTDWHQHEFGREHPETRLAVQAVDRAIAKMVEASIRAGTLEQTAFVVTGDHGFVNVNTELNPNVWLVEAGLHEDRPDRGDWRAAFHSGGGSAFLRLRDPNDTEAVDEVRRILNAQPRQIRKLFRIVEADELAERGADPDSPLAIAAEPGVYIGGSTGGDAVGAGSGGAHGFFPDFHQIHTGFVAWGAGVQPGPNLPIMGLEDVAPVVAALLRIPFDAPDGILRPGIIHQP